MSKDEKLKIQYNTYFIKQKAAGKLDTTLTFAQWSKLKKIGGSKQTKGQMAGLSSGDYNELMKRFGKKK